VRFEPWLEFASDQRFDGMNKVGKVYLVGAGPGDPGLLTLEALRLLKTADVVFHDDLVSSEILALIPSETYVENVGKRCGHARITQPQIHSLMVNAAKEGWIVVRLKSGDPLIFGRAGEELDAMRSAGVECAVAPGITAAFGAAARAGIPLTDRRLASRMVFLSYHQCAGKSFFDWEGEVTEGTTAVIYMPGADYKGLSEKLCGDGLKPETPCLLISRATAPEQKVHVTTLANLADAPRYTAPVLLIVGAVAAKYSGEVCKETATEDSNASPALTFELALTQNRSEQWTGSAETVPSAE
jgi:uroporphyrin-III C-methyltransferase